MPLTLWEREGNHSEKCGQHTRCPENKDPAKFLDIFNKSVQISGEVPSSPYLQYRIISVDENIQTDRTSFAHVLLNCFILILPPTFHTNYNNADFVLASCPLGSVKDYSGEK